MLDALADDRLCTGQMGHAREEERGHDVGVLDETGDMIHCMGVWRCLVDCQSLRGFNMLSQQMLVHGPLAAERI